MRYGVLQSAINELLQIINRLGRDFGAPRFGMRALESEMIRQIQHGFGQALKTCCPHSLARR
jgi:hypothetical protein